MSLGLKGLRQLFLWGPTRVALTLQAPQADQNNTNFSFQFMGELGWCSGYHLRLPPLRPGFDPGFVYVG